MNENMNRWLEFARIDLRTAELLFKEGIYSQACFHAHQSVEKYLKALIQRDHDEPPPRTHSLADLLVRLSSADKEMLPPDVAQILDDYYIPTRYPDAIPGSLPEGLPGKKEAKEAVELAHAVLNVRII